MLLMFQSFSVWTTKHHRDVQITPLQIYGRSSSPNIRWSTRNIHYLATIYCNKTFLFADSLFSLIIFIYVSVTFLYIFYAFCWRTEFNKPMPDGRVSFSLNKSIFGSDRSSMCHNVCLFVCQAQNCLELEHWISNISLSGLSNKALSQLT